MSGFTIYLDLSYPIKSEDNALTLHPFIQLHIGILYKAWSK